MLIVCFWLRQGLVAALGIFLEARGIFRCSAGSLLWHTGFSVVVVCRFSLSSGGPWA